MDDRENSRDIETPEGLERHRMAGDAILYLSFAFVIFGELSLIYDVFYGLMIYSLMAFALVYGVGRAQRLEESAPLDIAVRHRRSQDLQKVLMLVPVMRITSLSIPPGLFERMYLPLVAGFPVVLALLYVARNTGVKTGLRTARLGLQVIVVFSGLFLGLLGYFALTPEPVVASVSAGALMTGSLILLFSGILEELVYRSFIQRYATRLYGGRVGVIYASLIFALMHISFRGPFEMVYILLVSLYFGYAYHKTGSVAGVGLSHGLINVVMYTSLPLMFL